MTTCETFSSGAASCRRAAPGTSAWTRCSAHSVCCAHACAATRAQRREPATKPVGKPDAGNPHVRFDERGGETDRLRGTAPLLDSTAEPFSPVCLQTDEGLGITRLPSHDMH